MKPQMLTESASSINPAAKGKVSRKRLRERAVELAAMDGREPQDAGKSDWEKAKYELNGESEQEPETKAPSDTDTQYGGHPLAEVYTQTPEWLS